MAFHSKRSGLVLHREVAADGPRAISDEAIGLGESTSHYQVMKEIVKGFLCPSLACVIDR